MTGASFPMRLVWHSDAPDDPSNGAPAGLPWPAFVDYAISQYATHGTAPYEWMTAEFVADGDPDREGVVITACDPYQPSRRFEAFLKFVVDDGQPAILVWDVKRV